MKFTSITLVAALLLTGATAVASAQSATPRDELCVTDGTVHAVVQSGGTVYIGGAFGSVSRPAANGIPLDASTGTAATGFPKINGLVRAAARDGAGGWYIGGSFTSVGGVTRNRIAHIDASNQVSAWNPNANATVNAIVVSGSTVYVGGAFITIDGQSRRRIAALDATTGHATAWDPNASASVSAIAVNGNTVYVGGSFTTIDGQPRQRIAALDATTGHATAWAPDATNASCALCAFVSTVAVDGSTVYAGGDFTSIGGQSRRNIAALDAVSGLAAAWDPQADDFVSVLAVDGGTVYAGGSFSNIGGEARTRIAALDATSGLATSWNPSPSGGFGGDPFVGALAVDGSTVYVGGSFTGIGGEGRYHIGAVDATSGQATAWDPGVDPTNAFASVQVLAVNGGTVFAGGSFTSINFRTRSNLAAFDAASGQVTDFNQAVGSWTGVVRALAVSGNTIYAGGSFLLFYAGPTIYRNIVALDATSGHPVWAVSHDASGTVYGLAVDGNTVYAGGDFTFIDVEPRNRIAAIDGASGQATAWNPNADLVVHALAVSGGTVFAGGAFTNIGGQARNRIAALDATSGLATSWDPNADATVLALALDGGTLHAGGQFTSIGGQARNRIAAIDATSGLVTAWDPNGNDLVSTLAVSGSTVYAGGQFTSIGGQARNRIAAIDATSGFATVWNPNANGIVRALALDGSNVYVGGDFTSIGGELGRKGFAGFGGSCTPPAISCPADVSVECGGSTAPSATGTATATGTDVSVGFSDAFTPACGNTGVITRTWTATGTCGTVSCAQQITILDTTAPVVTITGPTGGAVYAVGTAVNFSGGFTDACGSPHTASWTFDAITQPGAVTEGAPGAVTAAYTFTAAGVYKVKLTVTDACGNPGMAEQIDGASAMVVIYDPSAGFVSGSGSIDSPAGAYPASPLLTGKANFGFVSKYKKGATAPTGETEFQFNAANLSFTSTAYEWLVVSGSRAQYKGTGTLNGVSGHGFLLTAVDGAIAGGGETDKFRIKITNASGVVYDNQISDPDDATPNTALRSGSIVINTGGKGNGPAAGGPLPGDGGDPLPTATVPIEYGLSQNHPNPFDLSTRIDFSLPERSRVTLVVYDLSGREVRTLADGEWEPGRHSATLAKVSSRSSTLGSGVYFVRMNAKSLASGRSFTSLRKLLVLR